MKFDKSPSNISILVDIETDIRQIEKIASEADELHSKLGEVTARHKLRHSQLTLVQIAAYRQAISKMEQLHQAMADAARSCLESAMKLSR